MTPVNLLSTERPPSEQLTPPKATGDRVRSVSADSRRVSGIERRLARRLLRAVGSPPLRFVLWNGEEIAASDAPPLARVVLRDRATFWKVLLDPNYQFGEAYSDGRLVVEGDLVAFLETINRTRATTSRSGSLVPSALLRRLHRAAANTVRGARQNIHHK